MYITWFKYILIGVVPVSPKNNIGISETCSFCNRAFAAPPRPLLASLVLRVFSCFRSRRPKDDLERLCYTSIPRSLARV